MSDQRIDVVKVLLDAGFGDNEFKARLIIDALDERALSVKWDQPRRDLLSEASGYWIPHADLLTELNKLPGPQLTQGDLRAAMAGVGITGHYCHNFYNDGDADMQAPCLAVYHREKRAGTAFAAITFVIHEEVISPARQKDESERNAKVRLARKKKEAKLLRSKDDFSPMIWLDREDNERYGRQAGVLYRIVRTRLPEDRKGPCTGSYKVFSCASIDQEGMAAIPHEFEKFSDFKRAWDAGR